MNDYTINNCQTDDPEQFKANLYKCLDVLEQHRGEQYAQLVLQMPETMEHNIWNYFIYADTEEGFTTSWQDYADGEDMRTTHRSITTHARMFSTDLYITPPRQTQMKILKMLFSQTEAHGMTSTLWK